jgi:hypothetical protein
MEKQKKFLDCHLVFEWVYYFHCPSYEFFNSFAWDCFRRCTCYVFHKKRKRSCLTITFYSYFFFQVVKIFDTVDE